MNTDAINNILIRQAVTLGDCEVISKLAHEIWNQHYIDIISHDQIQYMLSKYQSAQAVFEAINNDHKYYIAYDNVVPAGYCGIQYQEGCVFLSKIYIRKENRGRGIAKIFFKEILKDAKAASAKYIWLTVNMKNSDSAAVYKHLGFYVDREETEDIGNGFSKVDYIMKYNI